MGAATLISITTKTDKILRNTNNYIKILITTETSTEKY
jgi:hypothetical protein